GCQLHEPDPVREALEQLAPYLEGQTRLTAAPGAGERDQPVGRQELLHLRDLRLPPDEARELDRQMMEPGLPRRARCARGARCEGRGLELRWECRRPAAHR